MLCKELYSAPQGLAFQIRYFKTKQANKQTKN
jgi:hypothetical protein